MVIIKKGYKVDFWRKKKLRDENFNKDFACLNFLLKSIKLRKSNRRTFKPLKIP